VPESESGRTASSTGSNIARWSAARSGGRRFLFQRDQWDYFLRKGFGGYVYGYPARALRLELGVRRDKESSVRANDPWSFSATVTGGVPTR
jgi:hypothetical protein